MTRQYTDDYKTACQIIEQDAAQKLGRDLTPRERGGILNAGSLLMLEPVAQYIEKARQPEILADMLEKLAASFDDRLDQATELLVDQMAVMLAREITPEERESLKKVPTVGLAMRLTDQMSETLPEMREELLQTILDALNL